MLTLSMIDWMNCIWKSELPPNAKLIAAYLRSYMNSHHDMAWPSYSRMVAETGLSKSTVAKYLDILDQSGWLSRDRGCSNKNTKYYAVFPAEFESSLKSLGSPGDGPRSAPVEPRSARDGLHVVRETDTNKQVNKQVNKQSNKAAKEKFDPVAFGDDFRGLNKGSWNEWVEKRKWMRKPISKQAAKQQIKLLTKYSPDDQLKIINKSISGDYQGLFDLKPYELTSCGHNGQHKAAQSATSSPMRRIVDVMRDQNAE